MRLTSAQCVTKKHLYAVKGTFVFCLMGFELLSIDANLPSPLTQLFPLPHLTCPSDPATQDVWQVSVMSQDRDNFWTLLPLPGYIWYCVHRVLWECSIQIGLVVAMLSGLTGFYQSPGLGPDLDCQMLSYEFLSVDCALCMNMSCSIKYPELKQKMYSFNVTHVSHNLSISS